MSQIVRVDVSQSIEWWELPRSLVIKFFDVNAKKEDIFFDILDSKLVSLFAGQAGIGPEAYLIRPDCIVMQYIQSESLKGEDELLNAELCKQIAQKLARFHALKV